MIFKNRVNLFVICARVDNFEAFVINRTKYHDFLTFFNNGFLAPEYILITIKKILRGPYPLSTLTLLLRVKQEICKDTKSQTAAVRTSRTTHSALNLSAVQIECSTWQHRVTLQLCLAHCLFSLSTLQRDLMKSLRATNKMAFLALHTK